MTGSLILLRKGLLETYSARSNEFSPLLWRRRIAVVCSSSSGRVFSPLGNITLRRRSRLIRRSALTRRATTVGILLLVLGLRPNPEALGSAVLKGESETRLLLRTWLKEDDVLLTGVWCAIFLLDDLLGPSAGLLIRSGDQPELLLARIADFILSGGDVERVVAALPGDDERGDNGLLIE